MNKTLKTKLMMTVAVFGALNITMHVLPGFVFAFHKGGVGYCEGCHVLHKSSDEEARESDQVSSEELVMPGLRGSDPSSTCLRCHAEVGKFFNVMSQDGSSFTPAGDFYWLSKTFAWNANLTSYQSLGDNHGHNVVALDYGLNADPVRNSAPGGAYPSSAMGCTSCHNPHGGLTGNGNESDAISASGSYRESSSSETTAGNYRLLGGIDYNSGGHANAVRFAHPAPVAAASPTDWTETDTNHTAYGEGMSAWCGNCHSDFLDGGNRHPTGSNATLTSTFISNYNSYVKTGDITGTQTDAYLALVPFELGTADTWLLDPSSSSGPSQGANVMCLTCHRAHASAFQSAGRWDFETTFMADSHPMSGDGGVTANDVLNSYYGRDMASDFGTYQRQFCNKCHLMD
jgi:hypothetical protein